MVTVGLEPGLTALRLFGQVRNTRLASLPLAILVYSPRFPAQGYRPFSTENCPLDSFPGVPNPASSATGGASAPRPIDVFTSICDHGFGAA